MGVIPSSHVGTIIVVCPKPPDGIILHFFYRFKQVLSKPVSGQYDCNARYTHYVVGFLAVYVRNGRKWQRKWGQTPFLTRFLFMAFM